MPYHLLDCCSVWAAAIVCIMNQSDGTLSLRRVGCRGHGFGVSSIVDGLYHLTVLIFIGNMSCQLLLLVHETKHNY